MSPCCSRPPASARHLGKNPSSQCPRLSRSSTAGDHHQHPPWFHRPSTGLGIKLARVLVLGLLLGGRIGTTPRRCLCPTRYGRAYSFQVSKPNQSRFRPLFSAPFKLFVLRQSDFLVYLTLVEDEVYRSLQVRVYRCHRRIGRVSFGECVKF